MANYEVPEQPWKNFGQHFRFKLGRDSPSDARNILLVVTTLIVAVTFQAGLNPPSGVWQENNSSGTAGASILATKTAFSYGVFLFCNTLAFSAATCAILCLMLGCPFQLEVLTAIYSMNATYGASVSAVTPRGHSKAYIYIAIFLPYCLRFLAEIISRLRSRS